MDRETVIELIKDYHWIVKELKRIESLIEEEWFSGTSNYGIEGTLPKSKGRVSDIIASEVLSKSIHGKTYSKLKKKMEFIDKGFDHASRAFDEITLACSLDGMSYSDIAKHLGANRGTVKRSLEKTADLILEVNKNG